MKRCRHCRSLRPIEDFPRSTKSADGRLEFCRRCWNGDKEDLARRTARNEAINRLIARHRSEFEQLLGEIRREGAPL